MWSDISITKLNLTKIIQWAFGQIYENLHQQKFLTTLLWYYYATMGVEHACSSNADYVPLKILSITVILCQILEEMQYCCHIHFYLESKPLFFM